MRPLPSLRKASGGCDQCCCADNPRRAHDGTAQQQHPRQRQERSASVTARGESSPTESGSGVSQCVELESTRTHTATHSQTKISSLHAKSYSLKLLRGRQNPVHIDLGGNPVRPERWRNVSRTQKEEQAKRGGHGCRSLRAGRAGRAGRAPASATFEPRKYLQSFLPTVHDEGCSFSWRPAACRRRTAS